MRAEALERFDGGAVVTRANVSARHHAQMEIEEQRRELSHLARVAVLGQLSGALAHELRQPLSAILSNAEAARHLLERQSIDVNELRAILQDIATEDRRAAQVIDGLRAFLKRGETRMQPVDTGELVREVLQLAHAEMITRRVTATAVVEPNLPAAARRSRAGATGPAQSDSQRERSDERSRRQRSHAAADGACHSDRRCAVLDSRRGDGIPPALINRLFEPFVTTKSEGLGLGLSIARAIVAAHGGRSGPRTTAVAARRCIACWRPFPANSPTTVGRQRQSRSGAPDVTTEFGQRRRPDYSGDRRRRGVGASEPRRLCNALGMSATAYGSGRAFLEAIELHDARPDCLLLDIQMPEMTGVEVLRHMTARDIRVPTIIVTADDAPEARARFAAAGAVETLRKPIGAEELLAAIERAVRPTFRESSAPSW